MENLIPVNQAIYADALKQNWANYKVYYEQLQQAEENILDEQSKHLVSIAYYNLAKLINKPSLIKRALSYKPLGLEWVQWSLQMVALTSAKGNHSEAHAGATALIQQILDLIATLKLNEELSMFSREVKELINRRKNEGSILGSKSLSDLEMSRKFQTDCPLVTKKFHIADIMVIECISPFEHTAICAASIEQQFYYYLVYLSIACFTRATQKFYCNETSERDYHFKAIQIGGYLYSSKSTYLRFLKRTYLEHYQQILSEIKEEEEQEIKFKVEPDPPEVTMAIMPWEAEEQEKQSENQ